MDCGAFCAPATLFACQVEAAAEGDYGLAGALTRLAGRVPVQAVLMPEGSYWQDVDTPADMAHAQAMLRRSLAKPADGPVSRWLNRPLSTRLTMLLAPLRPSPNLVTWLVCGLGLLAAGLLAAGQGIAGGFLAQATSVVDGVDGELSRLQLRASRRGALLDGVLDRLADAAILAGLGVWALSDGLPATWIVALVAAAVTAALLSMATKDRIAALGLPSGPEHRLGYLLCWSRSSPWSGSPKPLLPPSPSPQGSARCYGLGACGRRLTPMVLVAAGVPNATPPAPERARRRRHEGDMLVVWLWHLQLTCFACGLKVGQTRTRSPRGDPG